MTDDIDRAIAAYRAELVAEAELARGDLAEIEDHLRSLIADLRDGGMPAGEAIAEAARRLGDPRRVAREHARVRTPFGTRLSRVRAWSAAALLLPFVVFATANALTSGVPAHVAVEGAMAITLFLGLCARMTWARPIVLGGMAFFMLPTLIALALWPGPLVWMWLAGQLGVIAFVAPWRRGELGPNGWALALQVWSYGAASLALGFTYTGPDGGLLIAPAAAIAVGAALGATIGIIVRGRWASLASLACAALLAFAIVDLTTLRFRLPHPDVFRFYLVGASASGVIASLAASVIGWRHASSTLGTLRGALR